LRGQEKSNQKRRPPRLALAAHPWAASPWAGDGLFDRTPVRAKRHRHPCRCPLRGLSSPARRRTGAPGRAAGHPGPHSVRLLGGGPV